MASCQPELKGKLVGEVEVKSSSTDVFHMYVTRPHHFPNICPSIAHSCHVERGEFGDNGSVIVWKYYSGGSFHLTKQQLENVDIENKSVTFICVGGAIMSLYKTFLNHLQVIPQPGNRNDLVRWTFEYEKVSEDVDPPTALLESVLEATRQADDYFLRNPTGRHN